MMTRYHVPAFLLLLAILLWPTPVSAQLILPPPADAPVTLSPTASPRIGLALGGGGVRGMAHIGVLKVLEAEGIPVDVVVGASMGSVVGALYASGYTVEMLEEMVDEINWHDVMSDRTYRRRLSMEDKYLDGRYLLSFPLEDGRLKLPNGIRSGQKVTALLSRLLLHVQEIEDFRRLPIPYGSVAADLHASEAVLLDHGNIVNAVRASMAIPGVFTPVEINGHTYVDGGVIRILPVTEARAMGADFVVAVDLSKSPDETGTLDTADKIINTSLRVTRYASHLEQRAAADLVIDPDVSHIDVLDFDNTAAVIAAGEAATRAALPQLHALVDSLYHHHGLLKGTDCHPPPTQRSALRDSLTTTYIQGIRVEGLRHAEPSVIFDVIDQPFPGPITLEEVHRTVERIHALRLFDRVSYRFETDAGGRHMVLSVHEKPRKSINVGVRYDSRTHTSILVNASIRRNRRTQPSIFIDMELGSKVWLQVQHIRYIGPRWGFRSRALVIRSGSSSIEALPPGATLSMNTAVLESFIGTTVGNELLLAAGLHGRYQMATLNGVGASRIRRTAYQARLFGMVWFDTLDRAEFARRGHHMFYKVSSLRKLSSKMARGFEQRIDWRAAFPLSRRLSLLTQAQHYTATAQHPTDASTPALIQHYERLLNLGTLLGGARVPLLSNGQFVGLSRYEVLARHMRAVMLGTHIELPRRFFTLLRANIGQTSNDLQPGFHQATVIRGAGITVGKFMPLGPVSMTLSTSNRHRLLLDIGIGFTF